jgi:uncharacterized protein YhaN
MRLLRLDLKAFGPFTDRSLEFTTKVPGLHLIFGPNEAGKSSSLRALKALLCGFPQQTPDNFLHNYDQLLVAGCLVNSAGQELIFQRRKKRVGDLLDAAGNPLDAAVLKPFLHGLEGPLFASLYGIDHDALVRGGEEILAQKGEVGQALFAAGAGIASVGEVIAQLEAEAGELFKATGQLPAINTAVRRFRELQKETKAAALSVKDWKEHRKALEEAEAARTALEGERDQKATEMHRLERLRQAVPELAALQARREQLLALGEVVSLDTGFAERYQQVSRELREAGQRLQRDRERLLQLAGRCQAISCNKELLREAGRVDDFHQRLGEYRKGQKDRPERNGMRITLRTEAGRLLQQVRPDLALEQVETLRPLLVKKRMVQTLASQYAALQQQLAAVRKQGRTAELEQQKVVDGFQAKVAPAKIDGLLRAIVPARKVGDIDGQLAKSCSDLQLQKKECLAQLNRLGLWAGEPTGLVELALPLPETVQQFENRFGKIDEASRELEKARKIVEKDLGRVRAEIKRLEFAGVVPSEEELARIRASRQQGWRLLRRHWLDDEDITEECREYAPDQPLHEVYEGYVGQADSLADRLRREADRVAGAAALRAQLETLETALSENDREQGALLLRAKEQTAAWYDIWQSAGIVPLSPKEMSGWLLEIDKLRFKVAEIVKKEEQTERELQHRDSLKETLKKELLAIGETVPQSAELSPVLLAAEAILEMMAERKKELERLAEQREKAEKDVRQAAEDLKTVLQALAEWQEQWRKALVGLARQDEVTPLEAGDLLETLQGCFDKLKEAEDLQKRIDGIDRDAAGLDREVKALLATVAPALSHLPLEQAILQLRTLLDQARKDGALLDQLSRDQMSLQEEIVATETILNFANERMGELLRLGQCAEPADLPGAIDRFVEFQGLRQKIAEHEENLAKIGAGVSLAELATQAAAVNIDEVPVLIETLRRDTLERLHPEINRLSQAIGEQGAKLAAMDGGARAAELSEAMERELALLRRLTGRYTLVKLAAKVLQQAIDRYREEHQDPVLKIAAGYFQRLTLGSFAGLRADVSDAGQPVLVGVRDNGSRLTVEKMSSGTRDQMFLALRLATLTWRLRTDEPMPFIVDDILINFDDVRSRATLQILAELGERNQVILFTHHRRLIEEAKMIEGQNVVQIHELAS